VPVFRAYDAVAHYVAISDADRHPDLTYEATIHHGIDVGAFTFRPNPGDYLLFLGRIHPDKGTHLAIEVARRAGRPLVIAGIVQDQAYFKNWSSRSSGRATSASWAQSRRPSATGCWVARWRFCISSASLSRSGSPSSSPWPPAHR